MNWKLLFGVFCIIGGAKEFISMVMDYHSGKLKFWPFGADITTLAMFAFGVYLVLGEWKKRK